MKFPAFLLPAFLLGTVGSIFAQGGKDGAWTDPADPSLPAEFAVQGEYVGEIETASGKAKLGAQVIALGDGVLQAVLLPGGLPGDGWNGNNKALMDGKLEGDGKATFVPSTGNKQYLAGDPRSFSATQKFPPEGHLPCRATIAKGEMVGKTGDNRPFTLKKITRTSPTLGARAPMDARILFDGSDKDAWNGGRIDESTGILNTDANDIHSKENFGSYRIHLEFMLPFKPTGRGQGRGNSGFYQSEGSEIQVLDSFGLDGLKNECGAVYNNAAPTVNMCFPPLTWQSYDVELQRADGKSALTVRHNGVVVHDKLPLGDGGPRHFTLQGHGNPLQYRNIWIEVLED